jgi:hypothetical protein
VNYRPRYPKPIDPNIANVVFETIRENPGLYTSAIVAMLNLPLAPVEDAVFALWRDGEIQCNADSTLRVMCPNECVFWYDS